MSGASIVSIQQFLWNNDVEGLRKILTERPELLAEKLGGLPPLVYAINRLFITDPGSDEIESQLKMVRVLLECGADVNATDTYENGLVLYDFLNFDYRQTPLDPGPIRERRMSGYFGPYDEASVKLLHEKIRTLLKEFNAISYIEETEAEVKSQYGKWDVLEKQKKTNPKPAIATQSPIVVPTSPFQVITAQDENTFLATKKQYEDNNHIFFKKVNWPEDYPREIWILPKDSLKKTPASPDEIALANKPRITWDLANVKNQTLIARKKKTTSILGSTPLERVIDLSSDDEDYAIFVKSIPFEDIPNYLGKDSPLNHKTHDHFSLATPHFSGMVGLNPLLIFKVPAKAILATYARDSTVPTFYNDSPQRIWEYLYRNTHNPEIITLESLTKGTRSLHNEVVVLGNSFLSDKDKVEIIGLGFSKGELDYFNGISPDEHHLRPYMNRTKFDAISDKERIKIAKAIDFFNNNTSLPIVLLRDKRFSFTETMSFTDKASWLLAERAYFLASLIKIKAVEKTSQGKLSLDLQTSQAQIVLILQDIDKQLKTMTEELEHGKKTVETSAPTPTLEFLQRGALSSNQKTSLTSTSSINPDRPGR